MKSSLMFNNISTLCGVFFIISSNCWQYTLAAINKPVLIKAAVANTGIRLSNRHLGFRSYAFTLWWYSAYPLIDYRVYHYFRESIFHQMSQFGVRMDHCLNVNEQKKFVFDRHQFVQLFGLTLRPRWTSSIFAKHFKFTKYQDPRTLFQWCCAFNGA